MISDHPIRQESRPVVHVGSKPDLYDLAHLAVHSDMACNLALLTQTADQFAVADDRAITDRENFWSAVVAQTGVPRDVFKALGAVL